MDFMVDYQKIRHALDMVELVTAVKGPTGEVCPVAQWVFKYGQCQVFACSALGAAQYVFRVPGMPADFSCELILENFNIPKTRNKQVLVSVDDSGLCIHLPGEDVVAKQRPREPRLEEAMDAWTKAHAYLPQAVVRYDRKLLLSWLKSIKHTGGKKTPDKVEFRVNLGGAYGPTIIHAGLEEFLIMPRSK